MLAPASLLNVTLPAMYTPTPVGPLAVMVSVFVIKPGDASDDQTGPSPQALLATILGSYTWEKASRIPVATLISILREFGFADGPARVAVGRVVERGLLDRYAGQRGYCRIVVANNGDAIAPSEIDQLFEPLKRRAETGKGTEEENPSVSGCISCAKL